jgi:hypothetical protein
MAARGKRALLAYIAPCDPTEVDAPPEGSDWIYEIKWDGYRAQVHIDSPRIGRTPGARRWPAADGALMGSQLPVAANRTCSFESRPDARDRLEQLRVDQRGQGRTARGGLAERHGISQKDINYAIDGYADDMLSDLVYSVERDLEHESEAGSVP